MKRNRFQTPPDTLAVARDSSLVLRLNLGFFLRQLGIFLIMDLLLCLLTLGGVVLYAEDRCADAAALVAERGVPTQEAMAWMGASDYTIMPLGREAQGYNVPVLPWLPPREEMAQGLRSWVLWESYTVELPNGGEPYAVRVELSGIAQIAGWVGAVLLICQGAALQTGLFGNHRSIRKVLREEKMIHPERMFLPVWDEGVMVNADPGLMKQVLRILMDNGVKYSPPGGRIYLRVSGREGMARVTVQDEGMGIPAESIPHIFERFYRTDQSRDRKTGGTGLGLSIAKWIVERHGGWFEVVSRENVGSRITFLIPLAKMETNQM